MWWLLINLMGCAFVSNDDVGLRLDADGDGHQATEFGGEDCDDNNPDRYPGNTEVYDGIDNNCSCDDDCCDDDDHDCDGFDGLAVGGPDCADANPDVGPGQPEKCANDLDDDCDGLFDEDDAADAIECYPDADLDGTGTTAYNRCVCRAGEVTLGGDCDDNDPTRSPLLHDVFYDGLDANCDGLSDFDADGDGFDAVDYGGTDCDDTLSALNPGATEIFYDGVDQDCDGLSDNDADGDGYDAEVQGGDDCDDSDAGVHPTAAESWYDGVDQNCDGNDDDADFDGAPRGPDDCDDNDDDVFAAAPEVCDNKDNDCDLLIDDDDDDVVNPPSWWKDVDDDGYGSGKKRLACDPGDPYVLVRQDCDDTNIAIHPAAADVCLDGVDANCNDIDDCTVGAVPNAHSSPAGVEQRLVGLGDVTGDGLDDMMLFGPDSASIWFEAGPYYDYSSVDTTTFVTLATAFDRLTVRAIGDVNGDGINDFAYLDLNSDVQAVYGGNPPTASRIIHSLAYGVGGGDATGDGVSDLFWMDATDLFGHHGPLKNGDKGDADLHIVFNSAPSDWITGADWTGDGQNDLVVASKRGCVGCERSVLLFDGDTTGDINMADADVIVSSTENVAWNLATADWNADGSPDLAAACYDCDGEGGHLLPGPVSAGEVTDGWALHHEEELTSCEISAGDHNNDDQADLALHCWRGWTWGTEDSVAFLVYGPFTGAVDMEEEAVVIEGDAEGITTARFLGDMNNDGADDLVLTQTADTVFHFLWGTP
jgi:hypothetical protein